MKIKKTFDTKKSLTGNNFKNGSSLSTFGDDKIGIWDGVINRSGQSV